MNLSFERDDGFVHCVVDGRVDSNTASVLRDGVLDQMQDADRVLVLDLSQVGYVSSAGLQSLLVLARYMGQRGAGFGVCRLTEMVQQVFEVAGFTLVIPVFADREDALRSLASPLS